MKRIVICDNEPHIVEGLAYLLAADDRELVLVRSGLEAQQAISARRADLLITDITMPGMNGLELIAYLQTDPANHDLPILILTARGPTRDTDLAREKWGARVLAKPFSPGELRDLVSAILDPQAIPQSSQP